MRVLYVDDLYHKYAKMTASEWRTSLSKFIETAIYENISDENQQKLRDEEEKIGVKDIEQSLSN